MSRLPLFSSKPLQSIDIRKWLPSFAFYLALVATLSAWLILVPNYSQFEILTAESSAFTLRLLGYQVNTRLVGPAVFLDSFEVTRECAGVQAIVSLGIFYGLLPGTSRRCRALVVSAAVSGIYLANVARITIELTMYFQHLLRWTVIHDYFGFGFSSISVILVLFFAGRLIQLNNLETFTQRFNFNS